MNQTKFYENFDLFYKENHNNDSQIVLFLGEESSDEIEKLQATKLSIFGAVFPEVIFGCSHYKKGILAMTLEQQSQATIMTSMQEPFFDVLDRTNKSYLLFVDGLSKYIDPFLEKFFLETDDGVSIIGGGAGKLTLRQEKIIFDQNGSYQDAALVISLQSQIGIGVNHGWKKMQGPFVATSTDENYLKQVDYSDSVAWYKQKLCAFEESSVKEEDFFEFAKKYPLGIETFANETVVRDAISFDENGLLLVGRIEENAVIYLLKGEKQTLIEAAEQAAIEAVENTLEKSKQLFVVDCISRVLFLEDHFTEELEAIKRVNGTDTFYGVLSLGEVANNSNRYIEFFNKTCVVGAF